MQHYAACFGRSNGKIHSLLMGKGPGDVDGCESRSWEDRLGDNLREK